LRPFFKRETRKEERSDKISDLNGKKKEMSLGIIRKKIYIYQNIFKFILGKHWLGELYSTLEEYKIYIVKCIWASLGRKSTYTRIYSSLY
jgi:hypothetical protein